MKKNINKLLAGAVALTSVLTLSNQAFAEVAGEDQIRVLTSAPKKKGESSFSYLVSWRAGDSYTRRANGLAFMNGSDHQKPTNAVSSALATCLPRIEKAASPISRIFLTPSAS